MDEEYRLRKFTKEDLTKIDQIEEKTYAYIFVKDSLEYLLNVLYRFDNYVVEKSIYGGKEEWRLRKNKSNDKGDLISIVDRIEEYGDELSAEERVFIYKVRNLITHQMRRLQVDEMFLKSRLKNKNNYLLEEHKLDKSENRKDRIIWLGSKEVLIKLTNEWMKNQFIDDQDKDKVISNFCDKNGELFTQVRKEKIQWCKKITELVIFIGEMANSKIKFIASEEIWVKVCKCFLNKDGAELNADSLAVTYQKAKPKSKNDIIKIISKISCETTENS